MTKSYLAVKHDFIQHLEDRHGYSESDARAIFETWMEYHGVVPESYHELVQSIYGHFDTKEAFARYYVEDSDIVVNEILEPYINWEMVANDLSQEFYHGHNGWVICFP